MQEAPCWAHARGKFYDSHAARPSPLTTEALRRFAELYVIEAEHRGKQRDDPLLARRERARLLLDDIELWLHVSLEKLSRTSDRAAAVQYALNLWPALLRCSDDGLIEIDNSAAERALRGVAIGRCNSLFAAAIYSLRASPPRIGLAP